MKQPKCPSMDKWMNTLWYIYSMDYYLAIKRNEALTQVTTWMNLRNKARHTMSHTVWFHLYKISNLGKFIETESRLVVSRG